MLAFGAEAETSNGLEPRCGLALATTLTQNGLAPADGLEPPEPITDCKCRGSCTVAKGT